MSWAVELVRSSVPRNSSPLRSSQQPPHQRCRMGTACKSNINSGGTKSSGSSYPVSPRSLWPSMAVHWFQPQILPVGTTVCSQAHLPCKVSIHWFDSARDLWLTRSLWAKPSAFCLAQRLEFFFRPINLLARQMTFRCLSREQPGLRSI